MSQPPRRSGPAAAGHAKARLLSTSEGRQKFPDLLQTCFGEKAVIGFGRYGRAMGAVVPMEAVRLLAGYGECVDEHDRKRIAATAVALLSEIPAEVETCGISDFELKDGVVDADEIGKNRSSTAQKQRRSK